MKQQLKEVWNDWKKYWSIYLVLGIGLFCIFYAILYLSALIDKM